MCLNWTPLDPVPPAAADCRQLRMKAYFNRADPCIFLPFLGGGGGGLGVPSNAPSHGNQREFPLFYAIISTEKQCSSSYHLSSNKLGRLLQVAKKCCKKVELLFTFCNKFSQPGPATTWLVAVKTGLIRRWSNFSNHFAAMLQNKLHVNIANQLNLQQCCRTSRTFWWLVLP